MWLLASSGICNGGIPNCACTSTLISSTAALYACMRDSALAGIFKFDRDWHSVQVICEHAQVIFGGLTLEGCVASHCPRNDLPRDI